MAEERILRLPCAPATGGNQRDSETVGIAPESPADTDPSQPDRDRTRTAGGAGVWVSEWPQCDCTNCRSRVAEAVALRARAGLLRESIRRSDPRIVVEWHAVELLAMLEARGMA